MSIYVRLQIILIISHSIMSLNFHSLSIKEKIHNQRALRRKSMNKYSNNPYSMTSLVLHMREPQIFCLWESCTPVWLNFVPLSEGVLYPFPKGIWWTLKLSIYNLQNVSIIKEDQTPNTTESKPQHALEWFGQNLKLVYMQSLLIWELLLHKNALHISIINCSTYSYQWFKNKQ